MTSDTRKDLLVEIGTEELPPKNLKAMMQSLKTAFSQALTDAQFEFDHIESYATPRRLALKVLELSSEQPNQHLERRGPALKAALDADGNPTKAAKGFMASCGVSDIEQLEQIETEKGAWLVFRQEQPGQSLESLLQSLLEKSIASLPIERRMRWGASRVEFVRPVHWIVTLYGSDIMPCTLFDIKAGRVSRGHRFMSDGDVEISSASDYLTTLEQVKVIADFTLRREQIAKQLAEIGRKEKSNVEIDEDLLDEVTALVEWPVALMGQFDSEFLKVPEEALISAMKEHQRYFHMTDEQGQMLPRFITISNIISKNPDVVVSGNERVILPRLTDARFFFDQDKKHSLESKLERLANVVFQSELGSYRDKTDRLASLAEYIADKIGADKVSAKRAAILSKSDLVSDMVNEFPDLQGVMGGYYATHDGEPEVVGSAIREHYQPTSSGGDLPKSLVSMSVAIADKIDTLVGMFGIGQPPSGSRDPFALRRQTIGVIRMCVEGELDLNVKDLIDRSIEIYGKEFEAAPIYEYLGERLKSWYQEKGVRFDTVDAVIKTENWQANLNSTNRTIKALEEFRNGEEAEALIAANKRVANILKKVDKSTGDVDVSLFQEPAETALLESIQDAEVSLSTLRDDAAKLKKLGELRDVIDVYFDQVMVMADDEALKANRIATMNRMRQLFLQVADISLLQQ